MNEFPAGENSYWLKSNEFVPKQETLARRGWGTNVWIARCNVWSVNNFADGYASPKFSVFPFLFKLFPADTFIFHFVARGTFNFVGIFSGSRFEFFPVILCFQGCIFGYVTNFKGEVFCVYYG